MAIEKKSWLKQMHASKNPVSNDRGD